jgi:anti-anti-sigma factor
MNPLASIEAYAGGSALTVRIRGEIDASNATVITRDIRNVMKEEDAPLHLDLTEVTFIDSAGLRMLQQFERVCAASATPLRVTVEADSTVAQLLEITALDRVLNVEMRER